MNEVLSSIAQAIQALSLIISVICLVVIVHVLRLLLPILRELRDKLHEPAVPVAPPLAPVLVPKTFHERIVQAGETLKLLGEDEPEPEEPEVPEPEPEDPAPPPTLVPPVCGTCKAKLKKITGSTILEGKTMLTFTCGRCGKPSEIPEALVPPGLLGDSR